MPFVDPNKDVVYYVKRYINETKYKDWFDKNYPSYTIYQAIGISEGEYTDIVNRLKSNSFDDNLLHEKSQNEKPESLDTLEGLEPKCLCCGSSMKLEKELEKSNLYRCIGCGISETRLK